MTNIDYIGYYTPQETISVEDIISSYEEAKLPKELGNKKEIIQFFKRFIGINTTTANSHITEEELIEHAFKNSTLEEKLKDIQLIIDFSNEQFFNIKNCGHYIKYKYDLKKANIVNISGNQCANLDVALAFCNTLFQVKKYQSILLCGGIKLSNNKRIAGSFNIMGDAYGIMVVSQSKGNIQLIDQEIATEGELYKETEAQNQSSLMTEMNFRCLNNLFQRNNIEDIKNILIPNGFPLLITQCLRSIGFNKNIINTLNIKKGHFAYLDSLINLKDFLENNKDFNGKILVISISYSGTIVCSIYNIQ